MSCPQLGIIVGATIPVLCSSGTKEVVFDKPKKSNEDDF